MDDFAEMVLVLSLALAFNLLLLALFLITTVLGPISNGHNYTPEWKKIQTKVGFFFSVCNLTAAICGAVYLRTLAVWVVVACPKMSKTEDCNQATKTWENVCWWFILPIIFAASMICSSCPRARTTLIHQPEQLYFLTDHMVSIVMFQLSLYLSLPLAYPFLFFRDPAQYPTWIITSLTCGGFMILAYVLGIAYGFEGLVKIWFQPRGRTPRPTIQEGESIRLRRIFNNLEE